MQTSPLGLRPTISGTESKSKLPELNLDLDESSGTSVGSVENNLKESDILKQSISSEPLPPVATISMESHSMSDTEIETEHVYSKEKRVKHVKMVSADGPLSDSEMDYSHDRIEKDDFTWQWGGLPSRRGVMPLSPNDQVQTGGAPLSNSNILPENPVNISGRLNTVIPKLPILSQKARMSLCLNKSDTNGATLKQVFDDNEVDYATFINSPDLLNEPSLVIEIGGNLYTWDFLQSLLVSEWAFEGKGIPENVLKGRLSNIQSPSAKEGEKKVSWGQWLMRSSQTPAPATVKSNSLAEKKSVESLKTSSPSKGSPLPKFYTKTLRLTSDQLKSLNLKYGANTITFSVKAAVETTPLSATPISLEEGAVAGQATQTSSISARIFLYKHSISLVVSDVDGTITKSDALGHLFTMVGKDWTHPGIANLYTNIVKNGYVIMYLTSRAIGQADMTRGYLKGIEQGRYQLPDGPVIMSPDRLLTALRREVIDRRPEEFKIAALTDIKRLFFPPENTTENDGYAGPAKNPFYAGFGNRMTDALSYRTVGIPTNRIYSINSNGEVKMDFFFGFTSSYIKLADLVDHIFPPIKDRPSSTATLSATVKARPMSASSKLSATSSLLVEPEVSEEFSEFNYWRTPLPAVEEPPMEELQQVPMKNEQISTSLLTKRVRSLSFAQSPATGSPNTSPKKVAAIEVVEPSLAVPAVIVSDPKSTSSSFTETRSWKLPWTPKDGDISKDLSNLKPESEEEEEEYDEEDETQEEYESEIETYQYI